jgi:hypothetical protein
VAETNERSNERKKRYDHQRPTNLWAWIQSTIQSLLFAMGIYSPNIFHDISRDPAMNPE